MQHKRSLPELWGARVRKARHEQGLSLELLAARAGIDLAHLSRGERGLAGFGDESRIRLATALGVRVEDLFPYPEIPESPCPPAASAKAGATSPTPATTAATRSRARSAEAPAASAREENPGNE